MRKLLAILGLSLLLFAPHRAFAQAVANSFDPCAQFPKSYAPINISSATTTSLIAPVANSPVYICGVALNQATSPGSLALEYGTGATCGTGTTVMMGPQFASTVATAATNFIVAPSKVRGTLLVAPSGSRVCALTTGSVQQSGWVTYVQTPSINAASFFDPCGQYPRSSVAINFSSATTTQLITSATNTQTYICGVYMQDAGRGTTANTIQIEYGTGTTCGTGTTNVGGVISGGTTAGTPTVFNDDSTATQFTVPATNNLCAVTTQSTTITGWVDYVQK